MKQRTFKTSWFSKAAGKAGIEDSELCRAMDQILAGQVEPLGGGVFKKGFIEMNTAQSS